MFQNLNTGNDRTKNYYSRALWFFFIKTKVSLSKSCTQVFHFIYNIPYIPYRLHTLKDLLTFGTILRLRLVSGDISIILTTYSRTRLKIIGKYITLSRTSVYLDPSLSLFLILTLNSLLFDIKISFYGKWNCSSIF